MSMITRCPDCATLFRVVADQLRVSEGWVRCGRCGLVFDGQAHLQDTPPPPGAPDDAPLPQPSPSVTGPMPESEAFVATTESWGDASAPNTSEPAPTEVRAAHVDTTAEMTFVRVARRKERWRRPWVRVLLLLVGVLLALALAVQGAVHERHRLLAVVPEATPWMLALCQYMGCSVGPAPMLDALVVESSTFNRLRGDQYRLVVQVRNSASVQVLLPAIELTLKDARDEVLLRKVLTAGDFATAERAIEAQAEWQGKAVLQLNDAALAARVTQFSTLAFYP